jgi:cell division protein FtsW (lipid II flippase)
MNKTFFALRRKLQKRRREKAKEEYYYSHLYQEQSYPSRVLQFYLTRFFVLGTSFIILLFYSGGERLVAAFLAALALVVIYHLIAKTEDKTAKQMFAQYANQLESICQGMSSRCNYIEQQEPQYKVFQNMLEPQQQQQQVQQQLQQQLEQQKAKK